jgi:predicted esterase
MEAAAVRLAELGPALAGRPVLLIGTGHDPVSPPGTHHHPVVAAYRAAGVTGLEDHVFPADHALSGHRAALARTVAEFLARTLR